jgi:hypothetical protein
MKTPDPDDIVREKGIGAYRGAFDEAWSHVEEPPPSGNGAGEVQPQGEADYERRVWSMPWIEDVTDPAETTAIRAAVKEAGAKAAEPQPSEEPGAKAREEQPHSEKEKPRDSFLMIKF